MISQSLELRFVLKSHYLHYEFPTSLQAILNVEIMDQSYALIRNHPRHSHLTVHRDLHTHFCNDLCPSNMSFVMCCRRNRRTNGAKCKSVLNNTRFFLAMRILCKQNCLYICILILCSIVCCTSIGARTKQASHHE